MPQLYAKDHFRKQTIVHFNSDADFLKWTDEESISKALSSVAENNGQIFSASYIDEDGKEHWLTWNDVLRRWFSSSDPIQTTT